MNRRRLWIPKWGSRRTRQRWRNRGSVPLSSAQSLQEFDHQLQELEGAIATLRQRFEQVRSARLQQSEMRHRLEQPDLPTADRKALEQQLEDLEVTLENSVLSWRSLQEPFWQAIRFGGLGIVIGWILKSFVNGG